MFNWVVSPSFSLSTLHRHFSSFLFNYVAWQSFLWLNLGIDYLSAAAYDHLTASHLVFLKDRVRKSLFYGWDWCVVLHYLLVNCPLPFFSENKSHLVGQSMLLAPKPGIFPYKCHLNNSLFFCLFHTHTLIVSTCQTGKYLVLKVDLLKVVKTE